MFPSNESAEILRELAAAITSVDASGNDWSILELELSLLVEGKLSVRAEAIRIDPDSRYRIKPTENVQRAIAALIGLRVSQSDNWSSINLKVTHGSELVPHQYDVSIT